MKIIRASAKLELHQDPVESLKAIELAGRLCWKSEDKITEDSYADFIENKLLALGPIEGHLSVVEHRSASCLIVTDRGVSHELVRHRLGSYSQECVVGSTKVKKNLTVKQLYDRQHGTCYDKTHNKVLRLRSVNEHGIIVPNRVVEVFAKGLNQVYQVTTSLGYKITCTMSHKFLTEAGRYSRLNTLEVGSKVFVNGRPCLLPVSDEVLTHKYLREGLTPLAIAGKFESPYPSVIRRLKSIGIFKRRLNDKDKEKYNKNHTLDSYQKMRKTIIKQYQDGRQVWNKGLTENEHPSVKRQGDALRKNHHNNGFGSNNTCWKGGPTNHTQAQILKKYILACELCETSTDRLEVHHKDRNKNNNKMNNLIKLCIRCHNLVHHGWHVGTKAVLDTITSITFVGIEETYDIEMEAPYHNYVADGFIVHNSTRYVNYNKRGDCIFIAPPWISDAVLGDWLQAYDAKTDKWEYDIVMNSDKYQSVSIEEGVFVQQLLSAEGTYNMYLNRYGWKPQQARGFLPNFTKTEIYCTFNLREWMWVFNKRYHQSAHPQMIEVMRPLVKEMAEHFPMLYKQYADRDL